VERAAVGHNLPAQGAGIVRLEGPDDNEVPVDQELNVGPPLDAVDGAHIGGDDDPPLQIDRLNRHQDCHILSAFGFHDVHLTTTVLRAGSARRVRVRALRRSADEWPRRPHPGWPGRTPYSPTGTPAGPGRTPQAPLPVGPPRATAP